MIVVGLMSGTSADGIDAAVVDINIAGAERSARREVKLLRYIEVPWSEADRQLILKLMNPDNSVTLRDLGRASSHLGLRFGEAAVAVVRAWGQPMARVDLIASHGQTVHHDPPFSTTQIGEPAVIAEHTGVTTASGFRAADIAAGGQGAPLTSIYDCMMLRPAVGSTGLRALQNIGGISNVTLVPASGGGTPVAFDTGPGNCWIDQAAGMHEPGLAFDRGGAIAGSGTVCETLLADMLAEIGFFAAAVPKSTGRELFSEDALRGWRARAPPSLPTQDFVATVTQLTAVTMTRGYLLHPPAALALTEVVLSGGGAKNPVLVAAIRAALVTEFGRAIEVRTLADLDDNDDDDPAHATCAPGALPEGLTANDAKEAIVFAVLGHELAVGSRASIPSCTGATGPRCLGSLTPGKNYDRVLLSMASSDSSSE